MQQLLLTLAIFSLCFLGIGIGLLIKGAVVKSSCGASSDLGEEESSCGACAKKEKELCPSDDETGLLKIAEVGNPQRTLKERDDHHKKPLEV